MCKITHSIIGGGWRAEFYLRIAKLMPDKFSVSCICVRNEKREKELVVGGYDEGNEDPSMLTFVYKTGFSNSVDSEKHKKSTQK